MKIKNKLNKLINEYTDSKMKEASLDIDKIINTVNNELYDETSKMYDSLIDQFYRYKTKSYIRHGEQRPGTMMGINLYRANNISKSGNWRNPKLIIRISAEDMDDKNYKYHNAQTTLDYITYGVRFPYWNNKQDNGSAAHLFYKGKLFSYNGTINAIYKEFDKDFNNISSYLFYKYWKKTIWCN